MEKIQKFCDLNVWKKAHELVKDIYVIVQGFPREEVYGLTSQLKRAVISITANIAEGFSRFYYKDRLTFYYDARGSLSEVQSELLDAFSIGLITKEQLQLVWEKTEEVHLLLGGLIKKTGELSQVNSQKNKS